MHAIVLLCVALLRCGDCVSLKSRAIIYIGPYKTGSTTVAEYLYDFTATFRSNNIYPIESKCDSIKSGSGSIKCISDNVKSSRTLISDQRNDSRSLHCTIACDEFHRYVSRHKNQNHTIIFGHEVYSSHMDGRFLKSMFEMLEGYDVWIVLSYRPLTSRMYSYQNTIHKNDKKLTLVYFDRWYEDFKWIKGRYFDTFFITNIVSSIVTQKYSYGEYKKDHRLYLIDFNNALKNHMEPHQVIHCDILQLCGPSNVDKPRHIVKNEHTDKIEYRDQVFNIFNSFVKSQNCKLTEKARDYTHRDEYWTAFEENDVTVPYITVTNSEARNDALQTHKLFYGLQALYPDELTWLYPNETLSLYSINNFKYEEVNRHKFQVEKSLIAALHNMMAIASRRKEIECHT